MSGVHERAYVKIFYVTGRDVLEASCLSLLHGKREEVLTLLEVLAVVIEVDADVCRRDAVQVSDDRGSQYRLALIENLRDGGVVYSYGAEGVDGDVLASP